MKKYTAYVMIAGFLLAAAGCKKDKEEVFPQFPPPSWENKITGQYTHSMTAVVKLPDDLQQAYQAADELAAFIGEECRAVAVPVKATGKRLFYLLIQGDAAEPGKVSFRYFSAASAYIYTSDNTLEFTSGGVYGTPDQPKTLVLRPRK